MALQSAWGYTNISTEDTNLDVIALGVVTNYAQTDRSADSVTLSNTTAAIDKEELINYRSRVVDKVNTNLNIQYPTPVKNGIEYGVKYEAVLSTTDTVDATFRVDEPVIVNITVKHPRSGNITATHVHQAVWRALSSLYNTTDDTWRYADLMRQAETPIED